VMVVTKTPTDATEAEKDRIRQRLSSRNGAPIFFAGIGYGSLTPLRVEESGVGTLNSDLSVLLLTGIANPLPLYQYVSSQVSEIVPMRYADHHDYSTADIQKVVQRFEAMPNPRKLILTTEKDAQRLLDPAVSGLLAGLPVYIVPIHMEFDKANDVAFRELVLSYCFTRQ